MSQSSVQIQMIGYLNFLEERTRLVKNMLFLLMAVDWIETGAISCHVIDLLHVQCWMVFQGVGKVGESWDNQKPWLQGDAFSLNVNEGEQKLDLSCQLLEVGADHCYIDSKYWEFPDRDRCKKVSLGSRIQYEAMGAMIMNMNTGYEMKYKVQSYGPVFCTTN